MTASTSVANPDCPATVNNATPALMDYAPIPNAYVELPSTGSTAVQLANESAMARPTGATTNGVTSGKRISLQPQNPTQGGLLSLLTASTAAPTAPSSPIRASAPRMVRCQPRCDSVSPAPPAARPTFTNCCASKPNRPIRRAAPRPRTSSSPTRLKPVTGLLAYYNPNDWTGRMTAYGLVVSSAGAVFDQFAGKLGQPVCPDRRFQSATTTCPTTGLTTPASGQPWATGSTGGRVMLHVERARYGSQSRYGGQFP